MYDPHSLHAEEFIDHEEVQETLAWAAEHARDAGLIDSILAKAALCKGLSHREASVLLACELPDRVEALYRLANRIKHEFYGNRIVMFAPLYLSNYCVNSCVYCPYHARNKHIIRKKLTQEEVAREVIALQDMGHKRLALEAGEHPTMNPIGYILDCIRTIYGIRHKNGAIRRVNVNIAATTVEEYRMLKDAGIGTYILFQETYHKQSYEKLHPAGPKHDYAWHTEAMDRAMQGGIDDVGLGVLFGLKAIVTNLRPCSCMPSIWRPCTAWARTPSACRASRRPTTSIPTFSTTASTTRPLPASVPVSAWPCPIPA